jgi:pyruvate dehydrogenase E2 component (dihydrolipoamide acetyltransferase)
MGKNNEDIMVKEIKVPEISESADTGTVIEILVSEGETIEAEQSIIAVETDKASVEIPASDGGQVKEIKVSEGDEVEAGTVILTVETEEAEAENGRPDEPEEKAGQKTDEEGTRGKKDRKDQEKQEEEEEEKEETEKEKKDKGERAEVEETPPEEDEDEEEEEEKEEEEEEEEALETARKKARKAPRDETPKEEVPAAPSVRRLARELAIDIYEVEGTGPGDRITADDVKAYARELISGDGREGALAEAPELPDFSQWGEVERESLSSIRRATARNTATAWRQAPHVTHFDEADIALAQEYIDQHAERVKQAGGKLTLTATLVKLAATALKQFPILNASIDMKREEIIYKKYIHIGLAVDTEHGLLVPVVRDADRKSITSLAVEITELAEKARQRKLSPEQLQGGTFVVTNLGGIGGTNFTPIVYHPQAAILGVSRAAVRPVYIDGELQPRTLLPLSLSYDHRLIDGAEAARFLRWLCDTLENPLTAIMQSTD